MRSKLSLRNGAILIALVAVTFIIGLYGKTNRSKPNGGNGTISLEPPFFISTAEASTGATAFPTDKAGISAYVKLTTTIDLDNVRTIFTKVEDIGDNYIIGITPIPNLGEDTEVHLYADTDGWLVAYLTKDEPAAKIMKWPTEEKPGKARGRGYHLSTITEIKTTTLQEALNNAGRAAKVRIQSEIKYYDFEFPDANGITLFVKGIEAPYYYDKVRQVVAITQVKIPEDYTLYEASYYHYGEISCRPKGGQITAEEWVKVDGVEISGIKSGERKIGNAKFGSYQEAIIAGVLHTIEISANARYGYLTGDSSTVATALIYGTN